MRRKSKLFILNWVFSYGSASSNRLLAYANSAAKKGIDVHIVALLRIKKMGYVPKVGVSIEGLYPCRINNKLLAFIISLFSTIWFLLTKVKKQDRILLYGSSEYLPLLLMLRRHQTSFEVTECPDLFHPQTYPFFIYKWLWKYIEHIFVISGNLKQYFVDHGINPKRIDIINTIVDSSRFDGIIHNPQEKYIAYCGNVNKDSKDGVFDLIKSFVRYHESFNDRKLYIIGPIVSEEEKQKYIEYLKLFNTEEYVNFSGLVPPSKIPELFVNAEMLVLARPDNIQAKYGFATKIGEYLLSGRPNVLTNVGNISDFLVDGENAFIAEPGDIKSIALKMMNVSSDPLKAIEVGKRGKETAMQYFNSDIETEKLTYLMFK